VPDVKPRSSESTVLWKEEIVQRISLLGGFTHFGAERNDTSGRKARRLHFDVASAHRATMLQYAIAGANVVRVKGGAERTDRIFRTGIYPSEHAIQIKFA